MQKCPFKVSWEYQDKILGMLYCLDRIIETQATTTTGIEYIDAFAHDIGFYTH